MKKVLSIIFYLSLVLSLVFIPSETVFAATGEGINVVVHSKEEIKRYIQNHPFDLNRKATYAETPQTAYPYEIGALDRQTLNDAINALNAVRYIAGLDEVSLRNDYNYNAQAASLVNCVNNTLSHSPQKPTNMTDDLYQKCKQGAGRSNLGQGFSNPADSIRYGYMNDSDPSNIPMVGHRRWCLNPKMQSTGFGQAGSYTAMYAFDVNRSSNLYGVCWPAQNMPIQYFHPSYAWSISMGYDVSISNVKVTLTRSSDNKIWIFSESHSDGDFYVNNIGYGQIGCIIFRPRDIASYFDGDVFNVKIEGLNSNVSYNVNFFDINSENNITATTSTPTSTPTTAPTTIPTSAPTTAPTTIPTSASTTVPNTDIIDSGKCGENVFWELDKDGTLRIWGSGDMTNFPNAASVPWYTNKSQINKVIIENGVHNIGDFAFFEMIQLTQAYIADGVVRIGERAFLGCKNLKQIDVPESVTTLDYFIFYRCSNLEEVIIRGDVTTLGAWLFDGCAKLERVYLPSSLQCMYNQAFNGCSSLKDVYYRGTPEKWNRIYFGSNNECCQNATIHYWNSVILKQNALSLKIQESKALEAELYPLNFASITWSSSDHSIAAVDQYGNVTGIGAGTAIITVTAGDSSASCTVTVENNTDIIDSGMYENIFWELDKEGTLRIWGSGIISRYIGSQWDKKLIKHVIIEDDVSNIGVNAFDSCNVLESVTIGNSVKSIGGSAFQSCSSLKSINISDSVTHIEDFAFNLCTSLVSVNIPDSVTSIEEYTFYQCSSLTSIHIPDSVTKIDLFAFGGCHSLQNVNIPENVTYIGEFAFAGCKSLKSVNIPKNISCIDLNAFKNCTSLTDVYFDGTRDEWNSLSIKDGNEPLLNATIHCRDDNCGVAPNVFSAAVEYSAPQGLIFYSRYTGEDTDKIISRGTAVLRENYYTEGMTPEQLRENENAVIYLDDALEQCADGSYKTAVTRLTADDIDKAYYVVPFAVMENGTVVCGEIKNSSMENIIRRTLEIPEGLSAALEGESMATLNWTKVNIATGYKVFRSTDNETFADVGKTTGSKYYSGNLAPDTTYYYRIATYVIVLGREIDGEFSVTVSARTPVGDPVGSVVANMYSACLGREASADDIAYYKWQLGDQGISGTEIAAQFIFSEEFKVKNYCDRHYVIALYNAFMGREPSEDEIANWTWRLQEGDTREEVFNHFATSSEFGGVCTAAGVELGQAVDFGEQSTRAGGYCTVDGCSYNDNKIKFAKRLYTVCLDREPDQSEVDAWHYNLVHGDYTALTASRFFLTSEEFVSHNYSDSEYITHVYNAMMGRDPSADDMSYWVWRLTTDDPNSKATREQLIDEFAASDEFGVLCQEYGVIRS